MANGEPNSGYFSTTQQPAKTGAGRHAGTRNKKTVALAAFKKMNYNPMEVQIKMVMKYQKMLDKSVGWDMKKPITDAQISQFCNQISIINKDLMTYQSAKASNETVVEYEDIPDAVEDPNGPLNSKDLLDSKKSMQERRIAAQVSLEEKIGS